MRWGYHHLYGPTQEKKENQTPRESNSPRMSALVGIYGGGAGGVEPASAPTQNQLIQSKSHRVTRNQAGVLYSQGGLLDPQVSVKGRSILFVGTFTVRDA